MTITAFYHIISTIATLIVLARAEESQFVEVAMFFALWTAIMTVAVKDRE